MAERPRYVILGRGRWAGRMQTILADENRSVAQIAETRCAAVETEGAYKVRLSASLRATGAQIAWLCVPPGPHIRPMLEATIESGIHAVVEKPWFCSHEETANLQKLARSKRIATGIHYEYCLLQEVEDWRNRLHDGTGLDFCAKFHLSRPNHMGLSALDNLGSHLFSIRAYALPQSRVSQIECAYELPDVRQVWVEEKGRQVASHDLLAHTQPIIQRFITKFEAALDGAAFPWDLSFALRVADDVDAFRRKAVSVS